MTTPQQTPKTQADVIKAHLMTGRSIDIWQSIHEYHITALSTRIAEIAFNVEGIRDEQR